MFGLRATVIATARQVSADLSGEAVVLHLDRGVYYGLNSVGARIWQLVQSPITVDGIVRTLLAEYEVERERCEADVQDLLARLSEAGLVEVHDAPGT